MFGIHDKNWLLSVESPAYRYEFVHDQETFSAKWLKEHTDDSLIYVFEDRASDKLRSQEGMSAKLITDYLTSKDQKKPVDRYIYLTYNNVVHGEFEYQGEFFSMSQYREGLASKNKLYSNGDLEIYK
ncbi:hypothetical protein ACFLUU_03455 [Chloroflexota bacterium]